MALGRELGFAGKGVRALGDLGGGAEPWEGEAAAPVSALLCLERGMLGAVPGPALPRDGVDPSAWAQPQRGGLNLSRRGGAQASQSQVEFNREKRRSRALCRGG